MSAAVADESPRSNDDRFYTPRASARTGGYSSGDDRFTPRTSVTTARSDAEYYTPRGDPYDNSSSSDNEEFYSSRDQTADGSFPVVPMPYASQHHSRMGPPGVYRSHSAHSAHSAHSGDGYGGVPPTYPRHASGAPAGTGAGPRIGRPVATFTVPSPRAAAAAAAATAAASPTVDGGGAYPVGGYSVASAPVGGASATYTVPDYSTPPYSGVPTPLAYPPASHSQPAARAAGVVGYGGPHPASSGSAYPVYSPDAHGSYGDGTSNAEGGEGKESYGYDARGGGGKEYEHDSGVSLPRRGNDYSAGPDTTSSVAGISERDIHDVWSLTRHNRYKEVQSLLDKGLPVNVRDKHGNTILATACQNGLKRIAKIALRCGADINARNKVGNTPLHFCFAYGYGDTLGEYLISKGADCTLRNNAGLTCREGIEAHTPRR